MAAISDSSPLILFAKIGRLTLLRALFSEILIPPAVREEVAYGAESRPDAGEIAAAAWIRMSAVADTRELQELRENLDPGEAEVLTLALDGGGRLPVLLDDRRGRRAARARGLAVVGSAGVLVSAKQRGLVPRVRPLLDELRSAGLYLGEPEYQRALTLAREWLSAE